MMLTGRSESVSRPSRNLAFLRYSYEYRMSSNYTHLEAA